VIEWLRRAGMKPAPAAELAPELAQDPRVQVAGRNLPIAIRRHPRARRLTMRLAPTGEELRITIPTWARTQEALAFAQARTSWIEAQLARVPVAAEPLAPGVRIAFRGQPLTLEWQERARRAPRREGEVLALGGPVDRIGPRIQRWLESEALALLAGDLAFYCTRAALPLPKLQLSRAKRRWGSCAAAPTTNSGRAPIIRINWRLVMAPDHVRRSVVAHEVAHLTHFDHSPAFHAHLARLFEGDLPAADAWLKCEGRTLYAQFA